MITERERAVAAVTHMYEAVERVCPLFTVWARPKFQSVVGWEAWDDVACEIAYHACNGRPALSEYLRRAWEEYRELATSSKVREQVERLWVRDVRMWEAYIYYTLEGAAVVRGTVGIAARELAAGRPGAVDKITGDVYTYAGMPC